MGRLKEWDDFFDQKDAHPKNAEDDAVPTDLDDETCEPIGDGSDLASTEQSAHQGRGWK